MKLSPRQREIVELVGRDGLTYIEVGAELGISVHTVRTHVREVVRRCEGNERRPRPTLVMLYYALARDGEAPKDEPGKGELQG